MGETAQTEAAEAVPERVRELLAQGAAACRAHGRAVLERRLQIAAARLDRPSTVLCVVGEYKQGKSLLVNALLGESVCPVDADLATCVMTVLHYREEPQGKVRRMEAGEPIVEEIPLETVWEYVSEQGNPDNQREVELVEIGLPNAVLRQGLSVVDTPGVGGFRAAHAATVLGFLPLVDALFFVTDASAELAAPEASFLKAALGVCPTVLVCLTKTDLYPEWRRIAALDRAHLDALGVSAPIVPLSSTLRRQALDGDDADLNAESGYPELLSTVQTEVIERAEQLAANRGLFDLEQALRPILTTLRAELQALEDPARAEALLAELEATEARLKELRAAGSRWSVALGDGFGDLRADADYRLRASLRAILQDVDREMDSMDPAAEWDQFVDGLQARVAAATQEVFDSVYAAADEIRDRIAAMLRESELELPQLAGDEGIDVEEVWEAVDRSLRSRKPGAVKSGFAALRGAQSGIIMLGMVGRMVGIALLSPLALGLGAVFGVRQLVDERKRHLEQRRQEARNVARQFLDQVQLEVGNRAQGIIRELHRQLRDQFGELIQVLLDTYTKSAAAVRSSAQQQHGARSRRAEEVRAEVSRLHGLLEEAARVVS